MLSDGPARPNAAADASAAAKPGSEASDTKDNAARATKPAASTKRVSAAAGDEALAKEALEGLKRIRAKARLDKMAIPKPAPVVIKPAVIVAKPPPPRPTWVAPLATLAVAAMLVVCACTGVIAYLTTQPAQNNAAANAEIRILRETVAQLRRQVSGVSENLDGLRTAVDQSSKVTNDRFGRFAENLDRIERVSSSSTVKLDKLAQVQAQAPAPAMVQSQPVSQQGPMMASVAAPEFTGSVPATERASAPRKTIKGWSVRQAYEGIAILQGPNGVIEAVLGQQVPGLGRIEEIRNENGRLVVESSGGVIYSSRKATP
ncbi:negative regulator of sigma E activity [Bradyrhizobium sp. USDA 4354]